MPLAGSYSDCPLDGEHAPDIQAAATAAVKALSDQEGGAPLALASIKSAAKQVVAGLNWRLVLEVTGEGGVSAAPPRTVTATVFAPLGGAPLQVTGLEQ